MLFLVVLDSGRCIWFRTFDSRTVLIVKYGKSLNGTIYSRSCTSQPTAESLGFGPGLTSASTRWTFLPASWPAGTALGLLRPLRVQLGRHGRPYSAEAIREPGIRVSALLDCVVTAVSIDWVSFPGFAAPFNTLAQRLCGKA